MPIPRTLDPIVKELTDPSQASEGIVVNARTQERNLFGMAKKRQFLVRTPVSPIKHQPGSVTLYGNQTGTSLEIVIKYIAIRCIEGRESDLVERIANHRHPGSALDEAIRRMVIRCGTELKEDHKLDPVERFDEFRRDWENEIVEKVRDEFGLEIQLELLPGGETNIEDLSVDFDLLERRVFVPGYPEALTLRIREMKLRPDSVNPSRALLTASDQGRLEEIIGRKAERWFEQLDHTQVSRLVLDPDRIRRDYENHLRGIVAGHGWDVVHLTTELENPFSLTHRLSDIRIELQLPESEEGVEFRIDRLDLEPCSQNPTLALDSAGRGNSGRLRSVVDGAVRDWVRTNADRVTLDHFCRDADSREMLRKLRGHIDTVLEEHGWKIEWWDARTEVPFEVIEQTDTLKERVQCEIKDWPPPVMVEHSARLKLHDISQFRRSKYRSPEEWLSDVLPQITKDQMFVSDLPTVVSEFKSIEAAIKEKVEQKAREIGYRVAVLTADPDLKIAELKRGFDVEPEGDFRTRDGIDHTFPLQFVGRARVVDIHKIIGHFDPDRNIVEVIKEGVKREILEAAQQAIYTISTGRLHLQLDAKDGPSADEEICNAIRRRLDDVFGLNFESLSVRRPQKDVVAQFYHDALKLYGKETGVAVLQKEDLEYSFSYRIKGLFVSNGEDDFPVGQTEDVSFELFFKSCFQVYEDAQKFGNHLKDRLKEAVGAFLEDPDRDEPPLQRIVAEEYGLRLRVENFRCPNRTLAQRRQNEEKRLIDKGRLALLEKDILNDQEIFDEEHEIQKKLAHDGSLSGADVEASRERQEKLREKYQDDGSDEGQDHIMNPLRRLRNTEDTVAKEPKSAKEKSKEDHTPPPEEESDPIDVESEVQKD